MAMTRPDSANALDRAITAAGSQSALARILGISQNAVSRWARGLTAVPSEHVIPIEEATGISRYDLRPDIYPREKGVTHVDQPAAGTRHHFSTDLDPAR